MASIGATNRITSMYSGMDTDQLVKSMVMNQQLKLDRISQKKQIAEWRKESYTEINNTLRKFKDDFISVLGSKTMMSSNSYKSNTVTMAANSNLKVSASSASKTGNYSVNILQTAKAASVTTSGKATTLDAGYSTSVINNVSLKGLTSLSGGAWDSGTEGGSFSINGVEIEFKATDTMKTIMDRVNNSKAGVTMSYSQISDTFTIESKVTGKYIEGLEEPKFDMVKPDVASLPDVNDPGYEAAKEEFDTKTAEYNAAYSTYSQALSQYNANETKNIKLEDTSGLLAKLGLNASNIRTGQDAEFTINGATKPDGTPLTSSSNSVSYDGIDFTFLEATTSPINFTVERDVKASVDKVKAFVEELNKMLEGLYSQISEKKNRKFSPLTDESKEGMTEKEIADWTAEAKKGTMYRDNYLDTFMNEIRSLFSANLGGHGNLASIGITSTQYSAGKATTLVIDEEKLLAALESDPDRVQSMFSEVAKNSSDGKGGFVTRVSSAIDRFTNDTKSNVLQALDNNLRDYTNKMKDAEDRLNTMADRYYTKFAKMESALSQMQSQSNQIAGYFQTGN